MEAKFINFIQVTRDFHIGGACTDEIVQNFKLLIDSGIIDVSKSILCTIKYDTSKNNIESGPVNIYFLDGTRVKLDLTAGYGGSGPRDTCTVLKLCNFDFNEEDILTHQEIVDIRLYKDIDSENVYQFANPDGSFEYSSL